MELPNDIEDILSDDYEEGEILEEDNLYEEVSSLEEFSCEEPEPLAQDVVVDLTASDDYLPRNHRKKDHKCKDDSVCRKERKGKHCYARIRKEKPVSTKAKVIDAVDHFLPDRNHSKRVDGPRVPTPPARLRMDYVKPYKHDYKDYHEKENRNSNKKHWNNSNDNSSRSRYKYLDKPSDRSRSSKGSKSKYTNNSSLLTGYRKQLELDSDSKRKTSLLKRLVGSGSTGVKTLKESDTVGVTSVGQAGESTSDLVHSEESSTIPEIEVNPKTENECENIATVQKVESEEIAQELAEKEKQESQEKKTEDCSTTQPTETKKKVGIVWKRSMKDDRDELHLRVEALKSAWVRKFHDRKRRGLINQRKSNGMDDSLADFVLGSSSDDEEATTEEAKQFNSSNFNVSDLSGDILKPEDMVIVTNDTPHEEPIIFEPALQIGTPLISESSVFIPSTLICLPEGEAKSSKNTSTIEKNVNEKSKRKEIEHSNKQSKYNKKSNTTSKSDKSKNSTNKSINRTDKKKRWRRMKKKSRRESKNSSSNSKELEEESILRENALMSLKFKSKITTDNFVPKIVEPIIIDSSEKTVSATTTLHTISDEISTADFLPLDIQPKNKNIKTICDSEGAGAISSDNLDEEIDEDILRAQLLSSLTKQVTKTPTNIPLEIETTNMNNNAPKMAEQKFIKTTNNKIWKNNLCLKELKIPTSEIKNSTILKTYNVTKVNDNRMLAQVGGGCLQPVRVSPIPQVAKLIISVNDSDSSSDMEFGEDEVENKVPLPADIEANIDLLLQEAKRNSLIGKLQAEENTSGNQVPNTSLIETTNFLQNQEESQIVKVNLSVNPSVIASEGTTKQATPQALKHLPAWQQEEYRRLKKKIAEKEKVLQEVSRAKVSEIEQAIAAKNTPSEEVTQEKVVVQEDVGGVKDGEAGTVTGCDGSSLQAVEPEVATTNQPSTETPQALPSDQTTYTSDDNNSQDKKTFHNIASCSVMEEINVMNDIVNEFDKNNVDYVELRNKWNKLKKALKSTEAKLQVKEKTLLEIKDSIQKKDRNICSRIDSLTITQNPPAEKNKPQSRDMELIKFKYKELSLRAQFLFHDFSTEGSKDSGGGGGGVKRTASKPAISPIRKKKSPPTQEGNNLPTKRSFSVSERKGGDWDPNTPVCHFDLNGICKDQECKYQHFKTV